MTEYIVKLHHPTRTKADRFSLKVLKEFSRNRGLILENDTYSAYRTKARNKEEAIEKAKISEKSISPKVYSYLHKGNWKWSAKVRTKNV